MRTSTRIGPVVEKSIRTSYDLPPDLAGDFLVWNVSKDGTRTWMAIPNHERYPEPAQRPAIPQKGVERETAVVVNQVLKEFNEQYGTDVKPAMS